MFFRFFCKMTFLCNFLIKFFFYGFWGPGKCFGYGCMFCGKDQYVKWRWQNLKEKLRRQFSDRYCACPFSVRDTTAESRFDLKILFSFWCLETRSHCVLQARLELTV